DEIEIAHDLLPPPITAGDANVKRFRMRSQIVLQPLRFRRDFPELEFSLVFLAFVNRAAEFFLGRFAESRQLRDATDSARFLELRDRADLKFLVERLDLLRAQA